MHKDGYSVTAKNITFKVIKVVKGMKLFLNTDLLEAKLDGKYKSFDRKKE